VRDERHRRATIYLQGRPARSDASDGRRAQAAIE
jgi:hypothetical protein